MVASPIGGDRRNQIQTTLNWITRVGIEGQDGILPCSEAVATAHLKQATSLEDAVNSVIHWRAAYGSGSGFVAELPAIAAMPVLLPASLAASYAAALNTSAAIAYLRGYDIHAGWVRTMGLLCLLESSEEVLPSAADGIHKKASPALIHEINQQIGFRLTTSESKQGMMSKLLPLSGGLVGVPLDVSLVSRCGNTAKKLFVPTLAAPEIYVEAIAMNLQADAQSVLAILTSTP